MIHITAFLKPKGEPKMPPKMLKSDVLDKSDYKNHSNSKLWPIWAGYLTLTMCFDIMIQGSGESKITSLNCQKLMFLTQNHYITNDD